MKIDVLTLFPEVVQSLSEYGVIGRAIRRGALNFSTVSIREFGIGRHRQVDDTVYGGAPGMLMMPQPVMEAIESVRDASSHVIYLSPQGRVLNQDRAIELAKKPHLILLCGHYEGVDARIIEHAVDEELSIGDYVLTGGELPAMVLTDAVVRWVDGVLGNTMSAPTDSLMNGLLQHDEFTKPRVYRGWEVPKVLLSGDHQAIARWREQSQIENTRTKRPDLWKIYQDQSEHPTE